MTTYIQFSGELSLQTVSTFQVKRVSLNGVARVTESEQFLLEEYEIGKIIRLWNPESWAWHPETAQGIRSPTSEWNPESKFYYKGRSPVPGIWNPLRESRVQDCLGFPKELLHGTSDGFQATYRLIFRARKPVWYSWEFSWGSPLGYLNPDPITGQKISFSTPVYTPGL